MEYILEFGKYLAGLAGFAALIPAILNLLKVVGVIKDGKAGVFNVLANFALLAFGLIIGIVNPEFVDWQKADAVAANLAQLSTLLATLIGTTGISLFSHKLFKELNLPVIGHSFSLLQRGLRNLGEALEAKGQPIQTE